MIAHDPVIAPGGFHHVALKARDFEASVRFYTQTLGFAPVLSWGEGDGRAVMLDTGDGSCIEIFASRPSDSPADCSPNVASGAGDAPEGSLLHFALRCDNPDAAIERVRAAGATVTVEPKTLDIPSVPPARVRLAFCKGPDGEVIEFFHRLK